MPPIIILAILAGILAGTVTGLFPGIHINLVAAILLASLATTSTFPPLALALFIVALATTHTFLDFIPSIYLGAPEEDSFLAVLPGHQLLQQGRGHEAVVLTLYGSLIALPIILFFTPFFLFLLPLVLSPLTIFMPYLLLFISLYLIFREKYLLTGLTVFLLAGFLGLLTFNLPVKEPLLPLLTGLFGASALIVSLNNRPVLPKQKPQKLRKIKLTKKEFIRGTLATIIAAPFASFMPGLGAGHAAVIGSELIPQERRGFLFLVGAINTIVVGLSFVTIFAINRTRTGAAAAVNTILPNFSTLDLTYILITIIAVGLLAFVLAIQISKSFAKTITKINYQTLTLSILSILLAVNLFFTNAAGILVLLTATALGVFAIQSQVRRINLMGALLLPTITFYFFL
jgi:putative membrane protein